MSKYWIIPITYKNWLKVKEYKIYGCRVYNNPRNPYNLIKKGDYLLFYIKKGEEKYSKGFIAVARVISEWYLDRENIIWEDEKNPEKCSILIE